MEPKHRVLIVEDDAAVRCAMRALLGARCEVICTDSVASGRDMLLRVPFAAMLVDRALPDGDGMSL
ncbi:MAG: DNA-binding response regulator, partial [Myxococcales bacterium]